MRKGIFIHVTSTDCQRLEAIVRDPKSAQKHVWRAWVVLLTANGHGTAAIMAETGAFEALSPAKKIAEALFNGQMVTADGKEPLSLNLIAANKQRSGWGRIFKQLKANGLLDAKNIRELMGERYQQSTAITSVRPKGSLGVTVVTTASGRQIIVDKIRQKRRKTSRRSSRRGSENTGKHSDALFGSGSTYRGRLKARGKAATRRRSASPPARVWEPPTLSQASRNFNKR